MGLQLRETLPTGSEPLAIALEPRSGKIYVSNHGNGTVTVIKDGMVQRTLSVGLNPSGLALTHDGRRLCVTISKLDKMLLVNTESDTVVGQIATGRWPLGVVVSPDDRFAYIANTEGKSVTVVDLVKGLPDRTISVGSKPYYLALSGDGKTLYVTHYGDHTVGVIDVSVGRMTRQIRVPAGPMGIALAPRGQKLMVTSFMANSLSIISTRSLEVVQTVGELGRGPYGVCIGNDPSTFAVTYQEERFVDVFQTADKRLERRKIILGPANPSFSILARAVVAEAVQRAALGACAGLAAVVPAAVSFGPQLNGAACVVDPLGHALYVANFDGDSLSVLKTSD